MGSHRSGGAGYDRALGVPDCAATKSAQHQHGQQVRRTHSHMVNRGLGEPFRSLRHSGSRTVLAAGLTCCLSPFPPPRRTKERAVLRVHPSDLEPVVHQREESHRLAVLPAGHQTHQLPHPHHGRSGCLGR